MIYKHVYLKNGGGGFFFIFFVPAKQARVVQRQ